MTSITFIQADAAHLPLADKSVDLVFGSPPYLDARSSFAEFWVKTCSPLGGKVLDNFSGSGTTMHACLLHGRHGIGADLRFSMCELGAKRIAEVRADMERPHRPKAPKKPKAAMAEPTLFAEAM